MLTTLDEGGEVRQSIRFQTLPSPLCHAEPNPARSGSAVNILCRGVPSGSVALLSNGLCLIGSDDQARCQGTAGLESGGLGLNPTLSFELNGGTAQIVMPLALIDEPAPPDDPSADSSLSPVPTLGATALGALAGCLLLSARRLGRHRRTS